MEKLIFSNIKKGLRKHTKSIKKAKAKPHVLKYGSTILTILKEINVAQILF